MSPSWVLRRCRDGDEQAILDLLYTVFGMQHSVEYWKWKYRKNPAGSPIIWLAECDNKIIGHYAIIPVIMKLGNAYATGSCAGYAATHPDYRNQGVFSSVVSRAYLDAAESDIPITYGFANTDLLIYKRYERMGHICFMTVMTKILHWEPFLARYVRNKSLISAAASTLQRMHRPKSPRGRLTVQTITSFDGRIDAFWEQISQDFEIIVKRDQRYLNWRYADHPENKYTIYTAVKDDGILGYCVLAQRQLQDLKMGLIVDILGFLDHRDVIGCLIDTAVKYLEQQGVDGIACKMSEKHPYRPILRKAGFITQISRRNRALHAALNLRCSPIECGQVYSQALLLSQNCLLKQKTNWFMTDGDQL